MPDLDYHVVFFDIATTGFQEPRRPIQIAAIDSWGNRTYNQYIIPDRDIEEAASNKHGFTLKNKSLVCSHGQPVQAKDLNLGLIDFADFLRSFGGKVVLVAHNNRNFDGKILLRNFQEFGIPHNFIYGFSDSLIVSRSLFREEESHRLPDMLALVNAFPRLTFDAMEAARDCRTLMRRIAAQRRKRFVEFVMNPRWFKTLDAQMEWISTEPKFRTKH